MTNPDRRHRGEEMPWTVPWLLASTALLLPSCVPPSARPQLMRTTTLLASEPSNAQPPAATGAPDAADGSGGSTYDDISAQLAASRARSYEQGRNGCCGKAADYLGKAGPPPGSPWARVERGGNQ